MGLFPKRKFRECVQKSMSGRDWNLRATAKTTCHHKQTILCSSMGCSFAWDDHHQNRNGQIHNPAGPAPEVSDRRMRCRQLLTAKLALTHRQPTVSVPVLRLKRSHHGPRRGAMQRPDGASGKAPPPCLVGVVWAAYAVLAVCRIASHRHWRPKSRDRPWSKIPQAVARWIERPFAGSINGADGGDWE